MVSFTENTPVFHGVNCAIEVEYNKMDTFGRIEKDIKKMNLARKVTINKTVSIKTESVIGANAEPVLMVPEAVRYKGEIVMFSYDNYGSELFSDLQGLPEEASILQQLNNSQTINLVNRDDYIHNVDFKIYYRITNTDIPTYSIYTLNNCVITDLTRDTNYNQYSIDTLVFEFSDIHHEIVHS